LGRWAIVSFAMVCVMFIVHTMPRHWVYLKMGLPDAYQWNALLRDQGESDQPTGRVRIGGVERCSWVFDRVEVSSCRLYIAHQRKKFSHRLLRGWLAQRGEQRAKPDQAFAHFLKPATYQDNFSVSLWRLIALQC